MVLEKIDKLVSLYIDIPVWNLNVRVDDFLVAVSKIKSNSVYHVAEVKVRLNVEKRIKRNYVKCYRSNLITMLKRDPEQKLIIVVWYSRDKKKK